MQQLEGVWANRVGFRASGLGILEHDANQCGLQRHRPQPKHAIAIDEVEGYFRISNMDTFLATDEEILSALEEAFPKLHP